MKVALAQTVCFAVLLTYSAAVPTTEKPKSGEVVHDTILLNPKGTDFSKAVDLTYTDGSVWIIEGSGGHVDIHDYKTGLHFVRANESAPCYVYPTMHSFQDGIMLEAELIEGGRIFENVDVAQVVPLSANIIVDASFAPTESAEYCDRYQWAHIDHYIISHQDTTRTVVKRSAQLRGCQSYCLICTAEVIDV